MGGLTRKTFQQFAVFCEIVDAFQNSKSPTRTVLRHLGLIIGKWP
jgi:hypothetical protein